MPLRLLALPADCCDQCGRNHDIWRITDQKLSPTEPRYRDCRGAAFAFHRTRSGAKFQFESEIAAASVGAEIVIFLAELSDRGIGSTSRQRDRACSSPKSGRSLHCQ